MALGLSGSFGAAAAQQALRTLDLDRLKKAQIEFDNQQTGIENSFRERQLADMEADTALATKRLGFEMSPVDAPIVPKIQGGLMGANGQRVMRGIHPITGEVIFEQPEWTAPEKPPTPENLTPFEKWAGLPPDQKAAMLKDRVAWERANDTPQQTGAGGMSETGRFGATMRLAQDWEKASTDARTMRTVSGRMNRALAALKSGDASAVAPASEAIQVIFQKILDPTSVVREGEFTRSKLTQSTLNRMRGALDKLVTGGTGIPLSELAAYAALAHEFTDAANEDVARIRSNATTRAQRFGLNPDDIFLDDVGIVKSPAAPPRGAGLPPMQPVGSRESVGASRPSAPAKVIRYDANGNIIR